jgi:hypothetical protein
VANDKLVVMPGYWFMYNMYALARNAGKYISRDKRFDKTIALEYDYLAPDSINEILTALTIIKKAVATAWAKKHKKNLSEKDLEKTGEQLLETKPTEVAALEILVTGFENSKRKVQLIKVAEAYNFYKQLIIYYGTTQLIAFIERKKINNWQQLADKLPAAPALTEWKNIGGQLIPAAAVKTLVTNIQSGKINSWDEVHAWYQKKSDSYITDKFSHSFAALLHILGISRSRFTKKLLTALLQQAIQTNNSLAAAIHDSRARDYQNPFRQMVYDTEAEMNKVIGSLKDNSFIKQQQEENESFCKMAEALMQKFR